MSELLECWRGKMDPNNQGKEKKKNQIIHKNKGFTSEWHRDFKTNLVAKKQQGNMPSNYEGE